ncbi:hypothetical protein R3W88_007876 [Solanum pinnatisectum]|uniref:Uncharacterized protein n=1 Tax=Solanum pinnatisectum TaxID=50273 RepID=A0AAV9M6D0_9SOLN|nr:hypothetical protein R3W88_007876 [Solanum pinnatisectum]
MAEELDQNQKIMSLRRERNFLLRKVDMLEAIHKVALEAKEMEIGDLKQKLDQLESTVMFYKGVFDAMERENKLKIQDNAISQKLINENIQVGESSNANILVGESSGANID